MNVNSLSHTHVQNQQPSSWIDDPFQLGTHAVKGFKPMSNAKALSNYAEELVAHYAKFNDDQYELSIDMLPEDEQNEIARLYIESIDREIEWACYGEDESINSDFLCALLSMLKDDTKESRDHFAHITKKNILVYYKEVLNEILITACDHFFHMQMSEQGLYGMHDLEHGEIAWEKF